MSAVGLYEPGGPLAGVSETIRPGGLALTERGLAFCNLPVGARVWDIGCGSATVVEYLVTHFGYRATGVDLSLASLEVGRQRRVDLQLVAAAGGQLPVANDQLDAVLAECSLSLIGADNGLTEFRRVVRPGGWLVLNGLYARLPEGVYPAEFLTKGNLFGQVVKSGFKLIAWEDHTDDLKRYAAQLIWAGRSLACLGFNDATCSKPGYYLLVAQKLHGLDLRGLV